LFGNPAAAVSNPPWPLEHPVIAAVLWSLLIIAAAAPLAIARYRARTTD
jgi:ABC-2 type transport system permease protein